MSDILLRRDEEHTRVDIADKVRNVKKEIGGLQLYIIGSPVKEYQ